MTAAAKAAVPILTGLTLLAAAVFFSVQYIDLGDSTCGTVLNPIRRLRTCSSHMLRQRAIVAFFVVSGFGLIAGPIFVRARRTRVRGVAWVCLMSLGLAMVLGLVATRAVAVPRDRCGSVVNNVEYEGQAVTGPDACGPYWSRQLRLGVVSGVAAVALATVGVAGPALARRHASNVPE